MKSPTSIRRRVRSLGLAATALMVGAGVALAGPVPGGVAPAGAAPVNTYQVVSTSDGTEPGTLRWAMTEANTSPGEDLIEISATGTLTLTSPLPETADSVAIHGPGADHFTIDGAGNRLFRLWTYQGSPIFIDLADMTLSGAPAIQGGVLLKRHGNATLDGVVISGNSGTSNAPLIHNLEGGVLTIDDATFTDNTGVVLHSDHGNVPTTTSAESTYSNRTYVSNSTFTGNRNADGCVIWTERLVRISDSSIVDNEGIGLCLQGLSGGDVRRTLVTRNTDGGIALFSWGSTTHFQNAIRIDDVEVYDNGGEGLTGAFYSNGTPRPADDLLVTNSTIFGNGEGEDVTGMIYESSPTNLGAGNVIGIPRPPRAVTGNGIDGGVVVTWSPPTSDSGSPVITSTVTALPGGATCSSSTTTCTVLGLENGADYTFTVVATNARGDSWVSERSAPVSPDPEGGGPPVSQPPTTVPPTPTTVPPTPTTTPATPVPSPTTVPDRAVGEQPAAPWTAPSDDELDQLPMGFDVPANVRPGETITLTGTGFAAGEQVQVIMRSTPVVLAVVAADAAGVATASVTIPVTATAGSHHLYMYGISSGRGVGGPTTVHVDAVGALHGGTAAPSSLAFTGFGSGQLLALALFLIGSGVVLLAPLSRRSSGSR